MNIQAITEMTLPVNRVGFGVGVIFHNGEDASRHTIASANNHQFINSILVKINGLQRGNVAGQQWNGGFNIHDRNRRRLQNGKLKRRR